MANGIIDLENYPKNIKEENWSVRKWSMNYKLIFHQSNYQNLVNKKTCFIEKIDLNLVIS